MYLIDLNILIYSVIEDYPQHQKANAWLNNAVQKRSKIYLSWITILGFLRVTTSANVYVNTLTVDLATEYLLCWLKTPSFKALDFSIDHLGTLRDTSKKGDAKGALIMDAHLAALALENGLTVVTNDRDFSRFPNLKVIYPCQEMG